MSLNESEARAEKIAELFTKEPLMAQMGLDPTDLNGAIKLAQARMAEGRDLEAFQMFCGLVLLDPMNMDFQMGLAETAVAVNAPEVGLQSASLVMVQHPDWPEGYYLSGVCCLAMGEIDAAREDLTEAVERAGTTKPAIAAQARRFLAACDAAVGAA